MSCPRKSKQRRALHTPAIGGVAAILRLPLALILTLTLNPAIDRNILVDRLVFEDRAYIQSRSDSAGGRGVNASRVLHSFGAKTLAVVTSGGKTGDAFQNHLANCGFAFEPVHVKKEIRSNLPLPINSASPSN